MPKLQISANFNLLNHEEGGKKKPFGVCWNFEIPIPAPAEDDIAPAIDNINVTQLIWVQLQGPCMRTVFNYLFYLTMNKNSPCEACCMNPCNYRLATVPPAMIKLMKQNHIFICWVQWTKWEEELNKCKNRTLWGLSENLEPWGCHSCCSGRGWSCKKSNSIYIYGIVLHFKNDIIFIDIDLA